MFPNENFLYKTINDAVRTITCTPIEGKSTAHVQCALGVCDNCPTFHVPEEEQYDGPNAQLIHFSAYLYQGKCAHHGAINCGSSKCPQYE
eukprot:9591024-Ditylum_brightwellii.AAC.1